MARIRVEATFTVSETGPTLTVLEDIKTVLETVLPYMVDNVEVRVHSDDLPDWLRDHIAAKGGT